MIVVADSSPLIYLSVLGRLEVLRGLYGTILVPRAVYDEVVVAGEGEPGSREVASAGWIDVRDVVIDESWAALEARLDPGEAAAIVLALKVGADLLVVDDRAGRREATAAGLRIHGTLGVLVEARRSGLLQALRPEIDALVAAGFRVSERARVEVLALVGE